MDAYNNATPLWDLSQASTFSSLPDDDFLALLQKQFPVSATATDYTTGVFADGINPQAIGPFAPNSLSPTSDNTSPSPPDYNNHRSSSGDAPDHDEDHALKRKASDESFDDEPSSKTQHTSAPNGRKTSSRRKSSGGPDEGRLMKRKEQNRAAQRAFRERKEKHVKDLEDKVAELQAQYEQKASENDNLREIVSKLQTENITLKDSSFTFSVPKNGNPQASALSPTSQASPNNSYGSGRRSSSISVTSPSDSSQRPSPPAASDPIDWNSLTAFDPSVLRLLDESPQQTATDGAMSMDFGFGDIDGSGAMTYTTLASNPLFMSFADTFDSPIGAVNNISGGSTSGMSPFPFDMQSLSAWPTGATPGAENNVNMSDSTGTTYDELFGGTGNHYLEPQTPVDFAALLGSPSGSAPTLSPVMHTSFKSTPTNGSSPASNYSLFNTPRDSSSSMSDEDHAAAAAAIHKTGNCPKTREELGHAIAASGPSIFAPPEEPKMHKEQDATLGAMIACKGANFPKTKESSDNVEVLTAWRSITSDPNFKDTDLNELCSEFTSKARCDGTKVVLEPAGVQSLREKIAQRRP